jgi:CBS domain-containing protein
LPFCSFPIAEKLPQIFRINEKQTKIIKPEAAETTRKNFAYFLAQTLHQKSNERSEGMKMAITAPAGRYNWMKVVDIMTRDPLTVTPTEAIGQADELMNTNKIRQLPVVQGKDLVGIVTDRDIRSFLSGSLLESVEAREEALNTKLREIMTTEPMTVSPDDDLLEAVEIMIDEKIGGIPVVDETEGLVGIVTYVDVLRCFLNRLQEE